jgi:hypothetical protein
MFAYAFNGKPALNAVGIAIVVADDPAAANVPVIGTVLAPNVFTVNV